MVDFQVAHYSPGRLRVRLAQLTQNPGFAAELEQLLSSIHGIRKVTTRPLTGSVLVEYDPETLDVESLLSLGQMLNLVPPDLEAAEMQAGEPGVLAASVEKIGTVLGSAIEQGGRVAGQALDPRVALPAMTLGTVARRLGVIAIPAVSPPLAAAWIVASMLLNSRKTR